MRILRGRGLALGMAAWLAWGSAAAAAPDYGLLDAVLLANVRNGYVDYDGIAADPRFAAFIGQLAQPADVPGDRADQLAYLINAYNAFAIQGILQGYSPATRFGRYRYFKWLDFRLDGAEVTLDEIEHRRIRPLGEARAHFAIVCASLSCPRLGNRAYLPGTLEEQLEQAARRFINDPARNRLDIGQKTAFVSAIFDWFAGDFQQAAGSVPAYLARYADDPAGRAALLEGRLAVTFLPYDWGLNGRFAGRETD